MPDSQEKNWRIVSMLRQMTTPSSDAGQRADDADRRAGHEEDAQDRAARRAHGAQDGDVAALVLHQHDQAGDDVERRDQHDQRQDQEHDVALDLQRREEGLVALAPVGDEDRPLRRRLDRRLQRVDVVGIVDEDLDRLRRVLHVEIELRLGERHVDDEASYSDMPTSKIADDRIGLDARRRAERRDVAVRRDQGDRVAERQAEILGQARADRDALAGSKPTSVPCLMLSATSVELAEVVAADAAHQRAGAGADRALTPAPGPRPAGCADLTPATPLMRSATCVVVVERRVDRLHDRDGR